MRLLPHGHPFSARLLWLVPHWFYPMNAVLLTASIYMMVAIAVERFVAVRHPLDYNSVRMYYCTTISIILRWLY